MTEASPADGVIRCFYAVEVDERTRTALAEAHHALRQAGADLSYPNLEDIHLTLIFLGHVFAARIADFSELLDRVSASVRAFSFRVAGVGTFGPPRSPRVVWAGVRAPAELDRLSRGLVDGLRALDMPVEDRPFRPHVTLARVGSTRGLAALTSQVASIRNAVFGDVLVRRTVLMRSHLERPDARYSVLHASPLKG